MGGLVGSALFGHYPVALLRYLFFVFFGRMLLILFFSGCVCFGMIYVCMHSCSIWCSWHVELSELVPAICCEFVCLSGCVCFGMIYDCMHSCSNWCSWHVEVSELVPAICCEFVCLSVIQIVLELQRLLFLNSEWAHCLYITCSCARVVI